MDVDPAAPRDVALLLRRCHAAFETLSAVHPCHVMGRSTSTGGIMLISETVVLWQMDAHSMRGKPLYSPMTSDPTGVMGDSVFLVKDLLVATAVKPC